MKGSFAMIILLEPEKHTVLKTDEYLDIKYSFGWKSCEGDPNVGKVYTKFMLPIRRKIPDIAKLTKKLEEAMDFIIGDELDVPDYHKCVKLLKKISNSLSLETQPSSLLPNCQAWD